MQSYCDYILENWNNLENGTYNKIDQRPAINYKSLLTEQIIRDNLPELTKEERILIGMDTMEIPKD